MPFYETINMKTKYYLKLSVISLVLCLSLTPLGGFGGHHMKFLAASLTYFCLTTYFLKKTSSSNELLFVLFILILPPSILYLPFHFKDFKETQISFISTLGHFIGVAFGCMSHFAKNKVKIILAILLLTGSLWITFFGFSLWLHKVNFGTFNGKVYYDLPAPIKGKNQFGRDISNINFKNKIILLDFWHTRCGVCFQKFPQLQEIYDTFKKDTSLVILAVNKPLEQDTIGEAFAVLKKSGYNFPAIVPSIDTLPEMFNVNHYPTTFIIDKSGKVIFKGDIENVKSILTRLTKNGM